MNFVKKEIEQYLLQLIPARDSVLQEMEERAARENFPIIGPLVGRLCKQVAISIEARDVFEMGSGFGYSTHWFSQAVGEHGRVVHTEGSSERSTEAKQYLERAGFAHRVRFEVGDATKILHQYPGPFDVVFIDIDKHGYRAALELARSRVRPGGYIITDNVLWSSRVVAPPSQQDENARGIVKHNLMAFSAPELLTTIVPLRDGVALMLRLPDDKKRKR